VNHVGYVFVFEGEVRKSSGEMTFLDSSRLLGLCAGAESFTIWVPNYREGCDEALQEAIQRARVIVDFHRDQIDPDWIEFIGALWHNEKKVFQWELV